MLGMPEFAQLRQDLSCEDMFIKATLRMFSCGADAAPSVGEQVTQLPC